MAYRTVAAGPGVRRVLAGAWLALLSLLAATSGNAQAAGGAATTPVSATIEPPADQRADWVVGFTTLRGRNLAAENEYLLTSIPRLLLERMAPIRSHVLSSEERLAHGRRVLTAAMRVENQRLGQLRSRRAELAFTAADTAAVDEQIATTEERLRELRALTPAAVEIAAAKPLRVHGTGALPVRAPPGDSGGAAGATATAAGAVAGASVAPAAQTRPAAADRDASLLPAPAFSPRRSAQTADLDLMVAGLIEEVEGFLFVEVFAFDVALDRRVLRFRDAVPREGVGSSMDELVGELAKLLIGEPWGTVVVASTPPEALVFLDGAFVGSGTVTVPFQPVGARRLVVTAQEYLPFDQEIVLVEGEATAVEVTLAPTRPRTVTVRSEPPGAAVYADSVWAGVTPLQLQARTAAARVVLRYDGYHDTTIILQPEQRGALDITLQENLFDLQEFQVQQRDRFYRRLGAFALSVAGPLVLGGAAADATQRTNAVILAGADSSFEEANRAVLIGAAWGATAVTAVFLGFMLDALGDYISAATRGGS